MSRLTLGMLLDHVEVSGVVLRHGVKGGVAERKAQLVCEVGKALVDAGCRRGSDARVFFVPGRIEVLGKHTDYAGGRSLVTAVEQGICFVAVPRQDSNVNVHAVRLGESVSFAIDPEVEPQRRDWANYLGTVVRRLARNFPECRAGAEVGFVSDLPRAAGMSSSSALVVGAFLVLCGINGLEACTRYRRNLRDKLALAEYLGTVENGQSYGELAGDVGVGTFGGSEDHTAMLCSMAGKLGQFAYCPTRVERFVDLPGGFIFAVGVSGVVAEKTGMAQDLYNRSSAMARAITDVWCRKTGGSERHIAKILRRGADAADEVRKVVQQAGGLEFTSKELLQRLEHFIWENEEIVSPAGDALCKGDVLQFGRLVDRSQELAERLLGNQVPETVMLARAARECGAEAASAFGAGFGGSVWALVRSTVVKAFLEEWSGRYAKAFPERAGGSCFLVTGAGPAAFELGR